MAKQYAGLESVEYSSTIGGAKTKIAGKISSDSSLEPDNTKVETTDGQVYGGGTVSGTVMFLDFADFSTIEGFMQNDTEKQWHFNFKDGTTISTSELIIPFARKIPNNNSRDGLQMWELTFEKYSYQSLV